MGRAEEKYEYLSKRDKYDPDVKKAVGNKSLTEKDANKVNKIQNMMREEREKKGSRNIVTSENREEFMKKKLKLADKQEPVYDDEYSDQPKFGVKYHNSKGEEEAIKHFDDETKAKAYMEKGNSIDKVGGKYSLHPIAPVPDRKYIKGTPEHKELKAKQKPINGMPTNNRRK